MNLLFRKSDSNWKWLNVVFFIISVSCLVYFSSKLLFAGDPSGENTYSDSIDGLKYSINFTWTLVAAFLVFSMQGGFVLLGGFLQSKNMLGYMAHCVVDGFVGALLFWMCGFAVMFGGSAAAPGLESGNWFMGWSSLPEGVMMFKLSCSGFSRWYFVPRQLPLLQVLLRNE
ncbi:MAG: hypothetical protein ACYSR1_07290 [Planctomycetota bacterium]|jgi:hypothetical protein